MTTDNIDPGGGPDVELGEFSGSAGTPGGPGGDLDEPPGGDRDDLEDYSSSNDPDYDEDGDDYSTRKPNN